MASLHDFQLRSCLGRDDGKALGELQVCAAQQCTVDTLRGAPLVRTAALMRTGSNFVVGFIRKLDTTSSTNFVNGFCTTFGSDHCASRWHRGAINPFYWKHAVFEPGSAYSSHLLAVYREELGDARCALGRLDDGRPRTVPCWPLANGSAELRWPRTPPTRTLLETWDELLDYRVLHLVVTKNPLTFASSLRSAEESWHCHARPGSNQTQEASASSQMCLAVRAQARAHVYARQWSLHHETWLAAWREAPARVVWAPHECLLLDPASMARHLSHRLNPGASRRRPAGVILPGSVGMSPQGSFDGSRASYATAAGRQRHLQRLPTGFTRIFLRSLNASVLAALEVALYGRSPSTERSPETSAERALALGSDDDCRGFFRLAHVDHGEETKLRVHDLGQLSRTADRLLRAHGSGG